MKMSKKSFLIPGVFLTAAELNDGGHFSGISGPGNDEEESIRPFPMKFDEWMQSRFVGDLNKDGTATFEDYTQWWADNKLGADTWNQLNPDVQWNNEWTK